nr:hypothetical protein [Actinobacillus pleuropneumoniae]
MATYNIIFYLAFILGVSLLSLELTSNNIFTLATILVVMSMIPIALTKMTQPEIPARERISVPRLLAISPLALATNFISGMLVNGFFYYGFGVSLKARFFIRRNIAISDGIDDWRLYQSVADSWFIGSHWQT